MHTQMLGISGGLGRPSVMSVARRRKLVQGLPDGVMVQFPGGFRVEVCPDGLNAMIKDPVTQAARQQWGHIK